MEEQVMKHPKYVMAPRNVEGGNEICYIQTYVNGYWQQISSGAIGTIQQDVEWWKESTSDPVRAVDRDGRVVAM